MTDLRPQNTEADSAKEKVIGAAGDVAGTMTEQGQAVAQTAVSEARDVAAHAKEQVSTLTAETRDQAMQALTSATAELETQLDQRLGDVTSMARTTAEELRALCEGRPEDAGRTADLARQASQRLDRFAERTDQLGVRGAAEEIADFGRRRPVAFLLGAAAAGVLVGRMARAGTSVQGTAAAAPDAPRSLSSPPPAPSTAGSAYAAPSVPSAAPPVVAPSTIGPRPDLAPASPVAGAER